MLQPHSRDENTSLQSTKGRSDFDIERSMRWSPHLDITKLKYTIKDGVVNFTGTVADRPSLDLARAIAIDAGARDINADSVAIE